MARIIRIDGLDEKIKPHNLNVEIIKSCISSTLEKTDMGLDFIVDSFDETNWIPHNLLFTTIDIYSGVQTGVYKLRDKIVIYIFVFLNPANTFIDQLSTMETYVCSISNIGIN